MRTLVGAAEPPRRQPDPLAGAWLTVPTTTTANHVTWLPPVRTETLTTGQSTAVTWMSN